jgi:hypothetical protein
MLLAIQEICGNMNFGGEFSSDSGALDINDLLDR